VCPPLAAIRRIRPALHIFGHIHQSYGAALVDGTVFVNAAQAGPDYRLIQKPIVADYDRQTRIVLQIGGSNPISGRFGA
jgi:hypothetical protein